jgi:hypothetical protein
VFPRAYQTRDLSFKKGTWIAISFNLYNRIEQLDGDFILRQSKEIEWPHSPSDSRLLYSNYYDRIHQLAHNVVCASCGCIDHSVDKFKTMGVADPHLLPLTVNPALVPFDFTSGVEELDSKNIMIDTLAINPTQTDVDVCNSCYNYLQKTTLPPHSLANYRWTGPRPDVLKDLTWIEEVLIARGHMVGKVVRLQQRSTASYFGIKGHVILLPQDTTRLLEILPIQPSSLPDLIRVVWTGRSTPSSQQLSRYFTVRKSKIYDALKWLVIHHEDYQNVTINESEFQSWPPVFIATELMDSMGHVLDPAIEDAARTGFATEDADSEQIEGDIPITASAILDVNSVSTRSTTSTLQQLSTAVSADTIHVVMGNMIRNEHEDSTYFTSSFPTLFPYGTGKHIDPRHTSSLPLSVWVKLLLRHSSR